MHLLYSSLRVASRRFQFVCPACFHVVLGVLLTVSFHAACSRAASLPAREDAGQVRARGLTAAAAIPDAEIIPAGDFKMAQAVIEPQSPTASSADEPIGSRVISEPSNLPAIRSPATGSEGTGTPDGGYPPKAIKSQPAQLNGPSAEERHITRVVALLLRQQHLLNDPLDDDHARRGLENYLEALDPMKVYFYQSDFDEFRVYQDRLDDMLKRGDVRFAYMVYNHFLDRVEERVGWVEKLLEIEHDFSTHEEIVKDPEIARYPVNRDEAYDVWRRRIKYDLLQLKADESEDNPHDRLRRRYTSYLKRMRQTSSDELLEMYLTSMTTGFDPHTTFMSASTLENFHITMKLKLEGIGAALTNNDGYTVLSEVIPGGAADKHGKVVPEEKLEPEDRIVSVGEGREGEIVDVIDMKLSDVVKLIRGRAGTVVRLGVQPGGRGETEIYTITRAKIKLKDKEARAEVFEEGQKPDGSPYRVGAILLPSFYMDMSKSRDRFTFKSTTRDVRRILDGFRKDHVDAVVLDLRRNGGGSLTEAIGLTGLFIDRGPVVQVKDSAGNIQSYDDLDFGMAWEGPLVVLTSKFSASASEIFAGAIQDYRRGIIVGDSSTHGKGTVQSLLELGPKMFPVPNPRNYGALKITIQQFYRPNGDSTQKRGVLADLVLPQITDHFDIAESDLDYALEFDRVPAANYSQYQMVNNGLLEKLRTLSQARQGASKDFQKEIAKIERYVEHKKRPTVSLNESEFLARLAEFKEDEEDEKPTKDDSDANTPIERDFYFDEILDITVDYVERLESHRVAQRY